MFGSAYYHTGIIVTDVNKAIAHYSSLLNTTFAEPAETSLHIKYPNTGTTEDLTVTVVYSRKNEPYIELIQATGEGVFSEKHAGKILYFGAWEKDVPKKIQSLTEQGVDVYATIHPSNNEPARALITGEDEFGARVEYVTSSIRGYTTAWAKTGKLPSTSHRWSLILAGVYTVVYTVSAWLS